MAAVLLTNPLLGEVYEAGDKLYAYETGTTTPVTLYQDDDLSTAHTSPVVADATGRFAPIYIDATSGDLKITVTDADDVNKYTADPFIVSDLAGLTTSVATLTTSVSSLGGRLTTAESEIDTLQTESADYESRISVLEASISGITTVESIATRLPVAIANWKGSATPTYDQNYGMNSTITRNSAGNYSVTFSSPLSNDNYTVLVSAGQETSGYPQESLVTSQSVSGFNIETYGITGGGTLLSQDRDVSFVVFDLGT